MDDFSPAELRHLQLVELDILKTVRDFCAKYDIQFWLDSGTYLGAVRHGGFIPWDDDIDIGMLRSDYDQFIELSKDEFPEGFSVHTFENTEGLAGMFAKVYADGTVFATAETEEAGCKQGIFVDVFPYDRLSSDGSESAAQIKNCSYWQRISYLWHSKTITVPKQGAIGAVLSIGCRLAHYLVRARYSRDAILENYQKAMSFTAPPSQNVCPLPYAACGAMAEDILVPVGQCVFEEEVFPCPRSQEEYLRYFYGENWMELPPESERRTHKPLKIDFGRYGNEQ